MSLWKRWKKSQASAARWDDPAPGDVRTFYLKRLLRAAPREEGNDLLWQRIRRQLKPLGRTAPAAPPLFAALASMGPRFAAAATVLLVVFIGLYALPDGKSAGRAERPAIQVASQEDTDSLFAEAMGTRSGDDILALIAYHENR